MLGGNWDVMTTWEELLVPTAADDVVATGTSGNLTNSGLADVCRSLDFTNYTGTFTRNASTSLSIGDGTAGAGNVALKLVAGMTVVDNSSAVISFVSTSTTQQTIAFAGKSLDGIGFNGVGGSWILSDAATVTGFFSLTKGAIDCNNQNVTAAALTSSNANVRTLTMGSGTWTLSGTGTVVNLATTTNLTFTTSPLILLTDAGASNKTFAGGGLTFTEVRITTGGTGIVIFTGSSTFAKLSVTGGGTKNVRFTAGTTQTLTGGTDSFFSGAASNLITIDSSSVGSSATISKSSGTVESDYLSLKDSAAAGGAVFTANNSTNVSGNSGWNFPSSGKPTFANSYRRRRAG